MSEYKHSLTFRVRRYCNETHVPIANPASSAQLGGTRYHYRSYIRVRTVLRKCEDEQTDTHTETDTQTCVTNIHFASASPHAKCNNIVSLVFSVTVMCLDSAGVQLDKIPRALIALYISFDRRRRLFIARLEFIVRFRAMAPSMFYSHGFLRNTNLSAVTSCTT